MMREEAYATARLSLLAIIEACAFVICFVPLYPSDAPWKLDCIWIGKRSVLGAALVFLLVFSIRHFYPWRPSDRHRIASFIEGAIVFLYAWNSACLAAAIMRTGGPATSLYGPLVAIQMTVMLILEIQKQEVVQKKAIFALLYFVIAMAAWSVPEYAGAYFSVAQNPDPPGFDLRAAQSQGAFWLTALGMAFGYIGYDLPQRAVFKSWLKRFDEAI